MLAFSCPDCKSNKIVTKQENYSFDYECKHKVFKLEYLQTFRVCNDCGCEYTDWVAEKEEEKAIKDFLLLHKTIEKNLEIANKRKELLDGVEFVIEANEESQNKLFSSYFLYERDEYNLLCSPIKSTEDIWEIIYEELYTLCMYEESKVTIKFRILKLLTTRVLFWERITPIPNMLIFDKFLKNFCPNLYPIEEFNALPSFSEWINVQQQAMYKIKEILFQREKERYENGENDLFLYAIPLERKRRWAAEVKRKEMLDKKKSVRFSFLPTFKRYLPLHQKAKNLYMANCPFCLCGDNKLGVSINMESYHCFHCQQEGDIFDFICKLYKCDLDKAIEMISSESKT